MRGIACEPVDASFFETAPRRFEFRGELPVSAEQAFRALEDERSWPQWFDGIRRVEWTSPRPFGVGTTRTVTLGAATVYEHFFRWEPGRRFSFYFTAHDAPLPLFRALAEDYALEDLPNGRSRFVYRVAMTPALPARVLWPVLERSFARQFGSAPARFARYLAAQPR